MELLETKICVRCKHYRKGKKEHLCSAERDTVLDVVTGKYEIVNLKPCKDMRNNICGQNAILYLDNKY